MQEFAAAAPTVPTAEVADRDPPPAPPLVQPLVLNQEAIYTWEQKEINARALIFLKKPLSEPSRLQWKCGTNSTTSTL